MHAVYLFSSVPLVSGSLGNAGGKINSLYLFHYVSVKSVTSSSLKGRVSGQKRGDRGQGVRRGPLAPTSRLACSENPWLDSLLFWPDPADEAGDAEKKRTATLKRHRRPSSPAALGSTHPPVLFPGVPFVGTNFRQFGKISSCQNGASHQRRREVAEVAPREGRKEGGRHGGLRLQLCHLFVPQFSARYFRGRPGSRRSEGRGSAGQPGLQPRSAAPGRQARPPARTSARAPARTAARRPPSPAEASRAAPRPGPRPTEPSVSASPALP